MEGLEKKLLLVSIFLMAIFAALVLYAAIAHKIHMPTAHQDLVPFNEARIVQKEQDQFDVYYVAKMWAFEPAELILPEDAHVNIYLSAPDVQHGFQVIGTSLNLMAIPGTVNAAHYQFTKKGEYLVVCHEYCGLNHQNMFARIQVVPPEDYRRLMDEKARQITSVGESVSAKYECTTCHSIDGTEGIGPTFKGMLGRTQTLTDGTQIKIDEAYFIDSIRNPDKQIVQGFEAGSMPASNPSDEEIKQIIAYIKALK